MTLAASLHRTDFTDLNNFAAGAVQGGRAAVRFANAALDSDGLTDFELYLFFGLLFSAGAETTRNAVAGGLLGAAFRRHRF